MVSRMNQLVAICLMLAVSQTSAVFWDDLRVTYSPNGFDGHFNRFPDNTVENDMSNWYLVSSDCANGGHFNGFQYIMTGDISAAVLYDVNGVVAGIQSLFEKSAIQGNSSVVYETLSPMYQSQTINGSDYYVLTSYFVDPSIVCTTGRNLTDLANNGTGVGLWFQDGPSPSDSVQIPHNRTEAIAEGWTKNNCFVAMGVHNFYRVENYDATNCTVMRPVFGLYNTDNELQGFGFIVPGTITKPHRFENPPLLAVQAILGETPDCIAEITETIGQTSMHVYFVDSPWFIGC